MICRVKDDKLKIEIPLNDEPEPSSTGKSLLLCSESRTINTEHGKARLSVNLYVKKPQPQQPAGK